MSSSFGCICNFEVLLPFFFTKSHLHIGFGAIRFDNLRIIHGQVIVFTFKSQKLNLSPVGFLFTNRFLSVVATFISVTLFFYYLPLQNIDICPKTENKVTLFFHNNRYAKTQAENKNTKLNFKIFLRKVWLSNIYERLAYVK